jgi:hypothetical protein
MPASGGWMAIDNSALSASDKKKIYEDNIRKAYPRFKL